jgi:glycosyltransferase involved in cell wall biosynthesis
LKFTIESPIIEAGVLIGMEKNLNFISIIMPVYNEENTVEEIVSRVKSSLKEYKIEVIVVDDGSRDRTGLILDTLRYQGQIKLIRHDHNRGKGEAIKSALKEISGDITVVQDGDLEYDPEDLSKLLEEMSEVSIQVVYGSRNLRAANRSGYLPFLWGGKFLSFLTSILFGQKLTDINTGYKVFRTSLLRSLNLRSSGFEFCEEVTAKVLRRGIAIKEVPVAYRPRKFSEGKKIGALDGLYAILALLNYRFKFDREQNSST